jgi:hypothetical protein
MSIINKIRRLDGIIIEKYCKKYRIASSPHGNIKA